MHTSKVTAL